MFRKLIGLFVITLCTSFLIAGCSSTSETKKQKSNEQQSSSKSSVELSAGQFTSIFNGENLAGWEGNKKLWSVEDGVIVGHSTKDNTPTDDQFLIWIGAKPADFELKLEFKIHNYNGGIQFRSEKNDGYGPPVKGYQADIDKGGGWLGACFEEGGKGLIARRGNKVKLTRFGMVKNIGKIGPPDNEFLDDFYPKSWNTYRIVADGNHLTYYINDHKITEVIDGREDPPKKGLIALQMKGGSPMKIEFRNIQVKLLD